MAAGVAVALVGGLMLAPVFWLVVLLTAVDPACTSGGGTGPAAGYAGPGLSGLSPAQTRRAATVVTQGRRMGVPDRGIVVALAVASRESSFRVLANDGAGGDLAADQHGIARSVGLPHDGVGTDHGSLGLFQQQWPWWGTMAELMDPAASAAKFYTALRRVQGWERLPLTVAAQRVQHSGYPDGYAAHERLAERLLAELGGSTGPPPSGGTVPRAASLPAPPAGPAGDPYHLGPVRPQLRDLVHLLAPRFAIRSVGGYRAAARDPGGHPAGLAADFMVPLTPAGRRQGDQLAGYARAHADQLGVDYLMWRQRIWSVARAGEGWRALPDRGNPTQNHQDHVHVNLRPDAAVTAVTGAPARTTDDPALMGALERWDCAPIGLAAGAVVYPLPAGRGHRDLENWGTRGSRWARAHTGTDLSAPCGTPVRAATAGRVIIRTDQAWAGRWLVQVGTGPWRLTTWYAHMRTLAVHPGEPVHAGQRLGEVGDLGNATGCHLHFEVHPRGGSIYADNINPTAWLARHVGRRRPSTVLPVTASGGQPGWDPTRAASPAEGGTATVVSYNIRFGQMGLAGVARDLAATGADIIGLQEVDRRPRASIDQARWLANRLGMHVYYGPNSTWPGKQRGNAILTRYPLTAVNLRLPRVGSTEPRGLIWARVNVRGTVLNVFVTHLHFAGSSRRLQARAVAAKIAEPACGTLLLGDLNSTPHTPMYRAVASHLRDPFATGRYGPGRTAPAHRPRARIDYILHSPQLQARSASVRPAGSSDHRAVKVTVSVPDDASCTP